MGLGGIALALYFTASFSLSSPMSQTSTQLQIAHSSTDRSETPSSNDASDRTSQRTFTDTSTVWGPGTLSGRALLALGEVTIRGIDNLVIRGRILALRQRVGRKLTGNMCNDLMELCRPTMYSARITKEAIRLTLTQLCGGPKSAVYMFAFSLCKWPRQEARLILLQLIHSFFEITWPLEWEPQRWYDILITIIQVKEGWKNLIVEAAALLLGNPAFPSIAMHPIHFICAEATAGLPESSLSILQYAYSPYMRAEAWIELQKCGLRLSERMSKIEKLVQETSTFASPQIMDALTDLTIFLGWDTELQPSALTCLKNVTQAQWQSLYRALGRQQARAERSLSSDSADTTLLLRSMPTDLADHVIDDLFAFCSQAASSPLIDIGAFMILRKICTGSDQDMIHCAVGICKLSGSQIQEILNVLLLNIPLLPIVRLDDILALFYNFLVLVCQISGKYFSRDVAVALSAVRPKLIHPILAIANQMADSKEIHPLARVQAEAEWDRKTTRSQNWMNVQKTDGPYLGARMAQIEHILSQDIVGYQPHYQYFDAIADASIFTSDGFDPKLRASAFNCIYRCWLAQTRGVGLFDTLAYYTAFRGELEVWVMQWGSQLPRKELEDMATLLGLLYFLPDRRG